MFTGIIEELGTIACPGARMRIECRLVLEDLREGASVAVSGVCLTAVKVDPDGFWCDLAPETLARTNLGALRAGSVVNLERAAAVGDRLSGHIVQGHVDGTAEFLALDPLGDGNWWLKLRLAPGLERYVIHKGSIALDGISLTVASSDGDIVGIAVIPHTYEHTAMRAYA
ncbi:MAG TPA: riboflavin synthase, partial [Bryobacteraceae bacterium]|nr:riboflavin synthase [Bryobacteraceae bacterium]